MYFDGNEPADNWDLIKSHSKKENDGMRDDIKRWLPNGTKIRETKFGDSKGFKEAMNYMAQERINEMNELYKTPEQEPKHPDYYKGNNKDGKAIEVFDIIDQFVDGDFYLGNVLKYVCRAGKKSKETKKQDLEKALHYIMEAIKRCNKENSTSEDKEC